jgi:hypothetical protein
VPGRAGRIPNRELAGAGGRRPDGRVGVGVSDVDAGSPSTTSPALMDGLAGQAEPGADLGPRIAEGAKAVHVNIRDVLGKDSTLFHFTVEDDDHAVGTPFVQQARQWFESVWTTISREYAP